MLILFINWFNRILFLCAAQTRDIMHKYIRSIIGGKVDFDMCAWVFYARVFLCDYSATDVDCNRDGR